MGYLAGTSAHAQSDEGLRAKLAEDLPDYMIPSVWVRLELPAGDAEREARSRRVARAEYRAEGAGIRSAERRRSKKSLASIWAEVLKVDHVSRDSDLFSLGADSIHLFQIAARANGKGIRLSARQLLDHRTVAALAALLEAEGDRPAVAAESRPSPLRRLFPLGRERVVRAT